MLSLPDEDRHLSPGDREIGAEVTVTAARRDPEVEDALDVERVVVVEGHVGEDVLVDGGGVLRPMTARQM